MRSDINIGQYGKDLKRVNTLDEFKILFDRLVQSLSRQNNLLAGEYVSAEQLEERLSDIETAVGGSTAWADITDKPSTYPPESHNHDTAYATIGHNHDGVYSPVAHTHPENYRANTYAVTQGDNPITFTEEFTADYIPLQCYCISGGGEVELLLDRISLMTSTGFHVNVGLDSGTLYYYMKAKK